jgi:DNA polymerase-3 subunit gamma/tau
VYGPNGSAPSDGCAEDCSGSITPGAGEAPIAVPGNADNTSNASAGTADTLTAEGASAGDSDSDDSAPDDSALDDNGPRQQQDASGTAGPGAAAPGGSASGNSAPGGSVPGDSAAAVQGNDQNRDGQQAEQQAETDRGNYAVEEEAPVIIAAPLGSYAPLTAVPRPLYSGAPIAPPAFPSSSWMPRPVPGLPALPPVSRGAAAGFGRGFPRIGGFAVGLGRR